MDIPNWEIFGSTMVSSQQIRLTADVQSRKGAIWNKNVSESINIVIFIIFIILANIISRLGTVSHF